MALKKYHQKRDFTRTKEPKPKKNAISEGFYPVFCIQKHAARHLHYDFRLEYRGVLLSWAIPKGPPADSSEKRLAIQVEDHPFEYRHFEGVIPKGQYGAGTVEIWDEGTYTISGAKNKHDIEKYLKKGLESGKIELELMGERLQGSYTLIRLKNVDKENSWLIIKNSKSSEKTRLSHDEKADLPDFIKPMLAKLIDEPFDSPDWLFEVKWDGYRVLAYIKKGKVDLYSRNNLSFNKLFSPLVGDLAQYPIEAVLDGEAVILDNKGKSNFQLMQNYQQTQTGSLYYYVFDLLFFNGKDLRTEPLIKRKELLKSVLEAHATERIRYSDHVIKNGVKFFKEALKLQLEGIIGKRMESLYQSKRSSDWVKIKTKMRQEAVIAGFTEGRGSRSYFGALLLGVYDSEGHLQYMGHTGGGFDRKSLEEVYQKMQPLIQKKCPFKTVPKTNAPATWITPKLVCEIAFSEWTNEGMARQPVFQGLRMDKKPKEVKREESIVFKAGVKSTKKEMEFSNLDKVYWPELGYTKGEMIEYYQKMAPIILPYLKNRPVMLHRYPDGINGVDFMQKDTHSLHLPDYVKTVTLEQEGKPVQYILIQNRATLDYVLNLGTIELHTFNATAADLQKPDYLVIDLDPEAISFIAVIEVAQAIHTLLDEIEVDHYCKTSGQTGLHIYLPMHGKYTFDQIFQFGQGIMTIIHEQLPKITSLERSPSKRQKKVYLDILQNRKAQTVISPYSLRGNSSASVSTPLEWSEVKKGLDPTNFTLKTVPQRVEKIGDIFSPILGKGVNLLTAIKKVSSHFVLLKRSSSD